MPVKQNFKRPLIGLTGGTDEKRDYARVKAAYLDAVWRSGGQPVLLPNHHDAESIRRWMAFLDGMLFTGGEDIHPLFFHAEPHPKLGIVDIERDRFELELCRAWLKTAKPLLAICRGLQLLNIACGGTLHQDLSERKKTFIQHRQPYRGDLPGHSIKILPDTLLSRVLMDDKKSETETPFGFPSDSWIVNSHHHQAIDKLGRGLRISATAPDGVIEAVELKKHPFSIAVQWHPEDIFNATPVQQKLFTAFMKSASGAS